jgi:ABC-type multidrug transport system permease subunit
MGNGACNETSDGGKGKSHGTFQWLYDCAGIMYVTPLGIVVSFSVVRFLIFAIINYSVPYHLAAACTALSRLI